MNNAVKAALITLAIILTAACSKRELVILPAAPAAVNGDASSQSASLSQTAQESLPDAENLNIAERYVDILKSGIYYIDCTAIINIDGMQLENPLLIAVNGDNSSISVSSDLSGAPVTMRTLIFDGSVYQINDSQRSYIEISTEQSANSFDTDFSQLRYITVGSGPFLGETFTFSEYMRGEQTVRFFFDGGTPVGLTQSLKSEPATQVVLKINGLSPNIPGRLVELPIGYKKE